jgi:hypothetical protein
VLTIVGAPATAAVVVAATVAATKSTVVAVATLLVTALLVTEPTKSTVLAVSAEVARVTTKALLVGLLLVQTLCTLARGALGG